MRLGHMSMRWRKSSAKLDFWLYQRTQNFYFEKLASERSKSKLHELWAKRNEDREDLIATWGPSNGKVESCNRAGMIYCFASTVLLKFFRSFFFASWKNGSENHVLQINNRGEWDMVLQRFLLSFPLAFFAVARSFFIFHLLSQPERTLTSRFCLAFFRAF